MNFNIGSKTMNERALKDARQKTMMMNITTKSAPSLMSKNIKSRKKDARQTSGATTFYVRTVVGNSSSDVYFDK